MSERLKICLLLLPALLVLVTFFTSGVGYALLRSFNYMPVIGLTEPNLDAFVALFADRYFYSSLLLTLHISFFSTLISSVLAVVAALVLRKHFPGRTAFNFLFQLNLTVPHLIGGIGILYLFSQSGSFARLAAHWGMIAGPADFPALVFDPLAIGIILQYVWKEVPFIGVIVLANLQIIGEDFENVARSLGASRWQAYRYVLLPQILPAVLAASAIVFAFTFGAYEIPALLGASSPQTLPVLAYRSFTDVDLAARPQAMALCIVISVTSAAVIYFYISMTRRLARVTR